MKLIKRVLALAFLSCVIANVSHAAGNGTIQYLASGSSALFIELGRAAAVLPDTLDPITGLHCYWTKAPDPNNTTIIEAGSDQGAIWIAWGPGPGGTCANPLPPYNIYSEISLDSVLGNRCFFSVDATGGAGCILNLFGAAGAPGSTPSLLGSTYTDTLLPLDVSNTVNGARMQEAATDIRPEDAKFAIVRMLVVCGQPFTRNPYIQTSYQTYGLGYQETFTPGVGSPVYSFTNPGTSFSVYDFNISGYDPFSGRALGARGTPALTVVGAKPIIVVVSPNDGVAGRLASENDIMFSTLAEYMFGGYGRTSDLTGDQLNEHAVTALIPEPQSGAYNVFEYSVPNSNEFKTSQDINNCNGVSYAENPLHSPSANEMNPGAFRVRALGTGQVTGALQAATTDTIGYFFWSAGNAGGFTATNGKYLTVNGVDPLKDTYTDGILPGADAAHPLTDVTFKNLNLGDYAIWSVLRIVSVSPVPVGVTKLVAAAQTVNATEADFIPLSSLKVWKSHYNMSSVPILNNNNGNTVNPATPGDLCPGSTGEGGGDAGAMNISIHGNSDFCTDFATPIGIIDKVQ